MADEHSGQHPPHSLDRRGFVKLGATGAATSVALRTGLTPAHPNGETATAGTPPAPHQEGPPPIGDLIDPTRIPDPTWLEAWIWRPAEFPGGSLQLHVVEGQNPGPSTSPGNRAPSLFSFGGISPAPTIRARGHESIRVTLRNLLGMDHQMTPVGPAPDPVDLTPALNAEVCRVAAIRRGQDADDPPPCNPFFRPEELAEVVPLRRLPGWQFVEHANIERTAHVTNLHTHGLHVTPGSNPDGTASDNVLLRVLPRADWEARQASGDPRLMELRPHERVGSVEYAFHLGGGRHGAGPDAPPQPHPPGTHWYHPHSHGSTHDQVASGMAGFLIIEGDVDDVVNRILAGEERPDPTQRTGAWDYRERLIFIQRVFIGSLDRDTSPRAEQLRFPPGVAVTGVAQPPVLRMRPGAIERWRVLNGSVDGSGFKRFMVLEGQYVHARRSLWKVVEDPAPESEEPSATPPRPIRRLVEVTRAEVEAAKQPLHMLAFDGITLVTVEDGVARHTIKDLSRQNAGTQHPLAQPPREGETEHETFLRNLEDCFRDGDSLDRCFNRPNEVYLANANRADVFFRAPRDSDGKVFTLFAQEVNVHTDNFQQQLQRWVRDPEEGPRRAPRDVIVGYLHVTGDPVAGGDFDFAALADELPPVPPFLLPIDEEELRVASDEARARGVAAGSLRTRVVSYSGTGGADWPLLRVPESYAAAHPELEGLVWAPHDGTRVLLPNMNRTMAINTRFDLAADPEPGPPRKFDPDDPQRSKVLVESAEEWVLYNCSQMLWSHTDTERFPQQGQWGLHYEAAVVSRAEGQRRFHEDSEFLITTKGSDHPFHIHINPMWVIRVDVPDENGALHNVLPEPRWMDTVPIPRNGGRVVFRSRFPDHTGRWVHHCHILLHEDNGMMQVVECVDRPEDADYSARTRVASFDMPAAEVNRLYPPPSPELMYRQNMTFVDPLPDIGQSFPGFELEPPVTDP